MKIKESNLSLGRFGDGELRWMLDLDPGYFQSNSNELSSRLIEVLRAKDKDFLVGIPDVFKSVNDLAFNDAVAWERLIVKYGREWSKYFIPNKDYVDANVTRPYIDRKIKSVSKEYFEAFKQIWVDKNIVIVEGSKTRFGVNNDLLEKAKSVSRVICPPKNAFKNYNEILEFCLKNFDKDVLFLCALGPTATILSYDLHNNGYRALDVGHVDIEYEWFKMNAVEKVPIQGKYVNEVKKGREVNLLSDDKKYYSEIINKIGVNNE